jgi:hypothetical protein
MRIPGSTTALICGFTEACGAHAPSNSEIGKSIFWACRRVLRRSLDSVDDVFGGAGHCGRALDLEQAG